MSAIPTKKYKTYRLCIDWAKHGVYVTQWLILPVGPPLTLAYHHRVGGPSYTRCLASGEIAYQVWDLNGVSYGSNKHEYQKALEEWLG